MGKLRVCVERLVEVLLQHHGKLEDIREATVNKKIHERLLNEQERLFRIITTLQPLLNYDHVEIEEVEKS